MTIPERRAFISIFNLIKFKTGPGKAFLYEQLLLAHGQIVCFIAYAALPLLISCSKFRY